MKDRGICTFNDWTVNGDFVANLISLIGHISIAVVGERNGVPFLQEVINELESRNIKIKSKGFNNLRVEGKEGIEDSLTFFNINKPHSALSRHFDLVLIMPDLDAIANKENLQIIEQTLRIDRGFNSMIQIKSYKNEDIEALEYLLNNKNYKKKEEKDEENK